MKIILILSTLLNVSLMIAARHFWLRARASEIVGLSARNHLLKEVFDAQKTTEVVRAEYLSLASAVADCVREVRKDIDRNYCHVHDGHVLDRLAHKLKGARGPVHLDDSFAASIRDAGGGEFITDGFMLLSGALAFAWHLHEEARQNSGALFEVVRESCGTTNRSVWLSKSLALYERICGEDKYEAIRSLSAVTELWKHMDVDSAARSVGRISG